MDADPTAPAPPPALAPPTGPAPSWPAPARPVFARFALPLFADTPIAAAEPVPISQPGPTAPDLALIAPYVDPAYYLASFPADETARRNPVAHFHQFGWRQGHNPNGSPGSRPEAGLRNVSR